MKYYHVTPKWDGKDLQTAANRLGEAEAIIMFLEKWGTEDISWVTDQVHKLFFYETLEDAIEHKSEYGGEILEIDLSNYDIFTDHFENYPFTDATIRSSDIRIAENN